MSTRILATADPLREVRSLITRYLFGTIAGLAGGATVLFSLLPTALATGPRTTVVAAHAGLTALSLAAMRLRGKGIEAATLLVVVAAYAALALAAGVVGWGLASPAMDLFALITCMVCAVAGRGLGLIVAAISAATVLFMTGAALDGILPGAAEDPHLLLRMLMHLLSIGAGTAGGVMISMVVAHFVRASHEREQRFRGLLGIAADAYWETDAEHRIIRQSRQAASGEFVDDERVRHEQPWKVAALTFTPEAEAALRLAMEERRPFREIPVTARRRGGGEAHLLISGEPRRDAGRRFTGFWGVSWDVSAAVLAQRALAATETRWRELFLHLPTPLLVHRGGYVLEANPPALALFGFSQPEAIVGFHFIDTFDAESAALAQYRLGRLDEMPVGASLPPGEYRMRGQDGRERVLRGTSVRVDAKGGPATLSLFVDETERRDSEERLRNSESLLSHLVATSPDLIMLCEMESGRFAMVNRSFVRLSGWSRAEAVGRSAQDLDLWSEGPERDRLLAALADDSSVNEMPVTLKTRKGQRVALRVSAARFTLRRKTYLVINARDVSIAERERLEREAILDNASIGIAFTRDQHFVRVNRRFEAMFGWPSGALNGRPAHVVWPSPEAYAKLERDIAPVLVRGEPTEVEHGAVRRDGSTFTARMLGKAVDPTHPVQGGMIWIVEDVTERRTVELALAKARDEAEAASRAKSAFLANTSHEIRTPLNALLGLAKLARAEGIDDARRAQYVEQISESAEALSQILTDILDLSKIEAGKMTLDRVPFDLADLLDNLQQAYAMLADTKGLGLHFHAGPGLPQIVIGDPVRVRQILINYLHNALKFTVAGSVRWSAFREPGGLLRFEVADTGPGIDPQVQERLFRPFIQADDSVTRRYGGTGLGLSICRELAELMGGRVGVRSVPGEGSTFWAVIPLPDAEAADMHTSSGGHGTELLAGARVLMVEDNAVNMMIGVAQLEQWGVVVEQASDGEQAIAAVDRAQAAGRPFDLVLMDVQMPVMGGHEATIRLRRRYGRDRLPIIALTAAALVSERETALAAGMNEFITKPIDPVRLRATIARVLSARS